ncbi:hypothetical protein BIV57_16965 [Mangrovactinospora gilvigrisea]|uniref:HTH arsR-type domain-containing protein n=1 Tax=Mangrovactinospora gilvigrisea TaxID=1428644 RepID=A0A1J7BCM0_9ACTN|nr:helix-turn-helix domain-containing protein [Mangrovactinospora gilvigrisea]OIV36333.1 hypothetical protein BIV57_16965 [Mangrovactinospora gilvigrisea]
MPLRIHFTADDLARVRLAADPDALWELVLSLAQLQSARVPGALPPHHRAWAERSRRRLAAHRPHAPHRARHGAVRRPPHPELRGAVRLLAGLVPPRGSFPDFLTPADGGRFGAGLESVRALPAARLRADLAEVFTGARRADRFALHLADGDREARSALETALTVYQHELISPHARAMDAAVRRDRALRGRDLAHGGVQRLLARLPHPIRWRAPVLETAYPVDRDLFLEGRGLLLIPSFFCTVHPVSLIDPELPPVLVYPAQGEDAPTPAARPAELGGLAALMGPTRATALAALAETPCSTSELAQRLAASPGTASKHASVLRDAGLVASVRQGPAVLHTLTRLGRELLSAGIR